MTNRVSVYIDGFNLYHSIDNLNQPYLKWVDLWALSQTMLKDGEVLADVKYFSAFAKWLPEPYRRHRQYVAALEAAGVTSVMSHFKKKKRHCKECKNIWTSHEEKETDVRIALSILADAYADSYDRAILISADSDLVPVIERARSTFTDKSYYVAVPPAKMNTSRDICGAANGYFEIRAARIRKCLLNHEIKNERGDTIALIPESYIKPE